MSLTEVVEQMGGIQTQYAPAGYIGLWSRMRDFTRPMLTQALEERRVVQATLMRTTIHMVSAADFWPMELGVRRIRREWFEDVGRRIVEELDTTEVAVTVRHELADGPLPMKELTKRLVWHAGSRRRPPGGPGSGSTSCGFRRPEPGSGVARTSTGWPSLAAADRRDGGAGDGAAHPPLPGRLRSPAQGHRELDGRER